MNTASQSGRSMTADQPAGCMEIPTIGRRLVSCDSLLGGGLSIASFHVVRTNAGVVVFLAFERGRASLYRTISFCWQTGSVRAMERNGRCVSTWVGPFSPSSVLLLRSRLSQRKRWARTICSLHLTSPLLCVSCTSHLFIHYSHRKFTSSFCHSVSQSWASFSLVA